MSRIRTLKPEWLEDEALLECSLAARVLSAGLLLVADDYGNGRAGEKILSARIFPGDPIRMLRDALAELVAIRYVVIYQADGQTYFHIRNWAKHQRVDKPGPAKVPAPPPESSPTPREPSGNPPEPSEKSSGGSAPRARPLPSPPDPITGPVPEGGAGGNQPEPAHERERPTKCPLDLAEKAEALGVLAELSSKLKAPLESVRYGAREFVSYWTIGDGAGKERSYWMRKLREEIRRKAVENRLAPPRQTDQPNDDGGLIQRARRGEYGKGIQGAAERGEQASVLREMVRKRAEKLTSGPPDPVSSPRATADPPVAPGALAGLVAGVGRPIP